jgi:hypothetical protein
VNGTFVLPQKVNPLPFGPPVYDAVPTGLAYNVPGDSLYVGELTGFPFPAGEAQIHELLGPSVVASGLTNIIDVAVAEDGTLYALSFDIDGILNAGPFGGLYRIESDGSATLLVSEGLVAPTGLAIGPDGAFYISNLGVTPDAGQVLRFVVPEPTSMALLVPASLTLLRRRVAAGK